MMKPRSERRKVFLSTILTITCSVYINAAFLSNVERSNFWSKTYLHAAKKTGGGLAPKPAGDLSVFDPEKEGKLQGTGSLFERIRDGPSYSCSQLVTTSEPPEGAEVLEAQNWLEDIGLPLNFAKPAKPVTGSILGSARIISDDAPGDIRHIIMKVPDGLHYVEGQSISVIPPGTDEKGKPQKPRLYSIASTRYGDLLDGNTLSLCVRRAEYYDPSTGLSDPLKAGVCSGFLCDAPPGTAVSLAGPVGKTMLLPEDPSQDIIMVATGTGIAPFRAFLQRLFAENTLTGHMFQGTAWLVLGVPTTGGLLYQQEFEAMMKKAPTGQLKIQYAISREMKNAQGGKLYVQNVIAENANEFFDRIQNGANVYFCGLKGMMPPILDTLSTISKEKGIDWDEKMKELKQKHQWHVEVY